MSVSCIIVAAGGSSRYGKPKLLEIIDSDTVIGHSITTARACADEVIVVCADDLQVYVREHYTDVLWIEGGITRSDSVRAGLSLVNDNTDVIVVHDAARPLASSRLFADVIAAIKDGADAAVPGVPVANTLKRTMVQNDTVVVCQTLDREEIVEVQTPQAFRANVLRRAHQGIQVATDDAALVEQQGGHVVVTSGDPRNIKITIANDLRVLRAHAEEMRENQ